MRRRLDTAEVEEAVRDLAAAAHWILRGVDADRALEAGASLGAIEFMRAAVAGATTVEGAPLVEPSLQAEAIAAAVSATGFVDAIAGDCLPGAFHAAFATAVNWPVAAEALEGRPVIAAAFETARKVLGEREAAAIVVVDSELLRFANRRTLSLLGRLLTTAAARAIDAIVCPELAAAATNVPAGGFDSGGVHGDISAGLATINSGSDAKYRIAMGPPPAKRLALLTDDAGQRAFPQMTPTGGTIAGIPVTVTDALTSDVLIVDQSAILAVVGDVRIETARAGAIEMATDPTNKANDGGSPPAPAETTMVSMFQVGARALKVRRAFDWTNVRANFAAKLANAGAQWGLAETSPPS